MRRKLKRPSPSLVIALTALVAALSGTAIAAIPGPNGYINSCYSNSSGALRVIDTGKGQKCQSSETRLYWQQAAPAGPTGPTGPKGSAGPTGDTGPAGSEGAEQLSYDADASEVSTTTAPMTRDDLGGPQVTVDVPEGGLVQVGLKGEQRSDFCGGASMVVYDESGNQVTGLDPNPQPNFISSFRMGGLEAVSPGRHTYTIYYANTSGCQSSTPSIYFRNRELWVIVHSPSPGQ